MKYVLYAILIYIAYQFIFKLVIPVFIASRKIKKGFQEMHSRMEEQMNQANNDANQQSRPSPPKEHSSEYIDFEEVK
ncbi:MAG: hypothetical protein ACT4OJ_00690 [Bacteroidota bacterium]